MQLLQLASHLKTFKRVINIQVDDLLSISSCFSPHDDQQYQKRHVNCVVPFEMKGGEEARKLNQLVQKVDKEVFIDFGFPIGASVNGYRFVSPKNHLYSDQAVIQDCNIKECHNKPCYCTHFIGKCTQGSSQK